MRAFSPIFLIGYLLLVLLSGCEKKTTPDTLRHQLNDVKEQLVKELALIEAPDQFEAHESTVSELFLDVAEGMLLMKSFPKENSQGIVNQEDTNLSEGLYLQCTRIIELPGGEDWLVRCQAKAVHLLDKQTHT